MLNKRVQLIDRKTIAVEAFSADNFRSKVTKVDSVHYSTKSPVELIDEACITHASTLEGRKQAVMKTCNYYKPPVIISLFNLSFFPTSSYSNYDCTFIFNHPFQLFEAGKGKARLLFYGTIDISVNASVYTLTQQQQRLHTILNLFQSKHDDHLK